MPAASISSHRSAGLVGLAVGALVLAMLQVVLMSATGTSAAAKETGGYPQAHAKDCSGRFGQYSWCIDENKNGRFDPGEQNSPRSYDYKNCTDWVAWRLQSLGVKRAKYAGLGNAKKWANAAPIAGRSVGTKPRKYAAAVKTTGTYGHVAFVEAVHKDGTITVSEYNKSKKPKYYGSYSTWRGKPAARGFSKFVYFTIPKATSGDPKGALDLAKSPAPAKVRVRGWAFDPNAKTKPVGIHVYIGGKAGTKGAELKQIATANKPRADVAKKHPGVGKNHGFDTTFATSKRGKVAVFVYALNRKGTPGKRVLLGSKTITVAAPPAPTGTGWKSIRAGSTSSCGIKGDGTGWCWGVTFHTGEVKEYAKPQKIGPQTWRTLTTNGGNACGIRTDGTAWCWGMNPYGELGDGTTTERLKPTQVGAASDWRTISPAGNVTCGIREDNSLWCWGLNEAGAVGDGTTTDRYRPTKVVGDHEWRSVSAGGWHVCAIRSDGSLWCWGMAGALGDGSSQDRLVPTRVGTASDWAQVSGGGNSTCAIKADKSLWCWGLNHFGAVGDGTTTDRTTPVRISAGNDWKSVDAGLYNACAVRTNGSAWCWGDNRGGELGDGTTDQRTSPTQVSGPILWSSVSVGPLVGCGISQDRTAWCWGTNIQGQVGDGTRQLRLTPVPITG